jgi:hypothetical protein
MSAKQTISPPYLRTCYERSASDLKRSLCEGVWDVSDELLSSFGSTSDYENEVVLSDGAHLPWVQAKSILRYKGYSASLKRVLILVSVCSKLVQTLTP